MVDGDERIDTSVVAPEDPVPGVIEVSRSSSMGGGAAEEALWISGVGECCSPSSTEVIPIQGSPPPGKVMFLYTKA